MKRVLFSLLSVVAACTSHPDIGEAPAVAPSTATAPAAAPAPPSAPHEAPPHDPPPTAAAPGYAARATEPANRAGDDANPRTVRRPEPARGNPASNAAAAPSEAEIELGRLLFFDRRLAKDGDRSCNSCHRLDRYGVDNQPIQPAVQAARGRYKAPSAYHAVGNFRKFLDGRADPVVEPAKGAGSNAPETALPNPASVVATLQRIPGYVTAFSVAFPADASPVSHDNIGRALAAFERQLVTSSRWDRYLDGDHNALTAAQVAGFKLFSEIGCTTCHKGDSVGGTMYQKLGVAKPWMSGSEGKGESLSADARFKVPSLRNVTKTAPYFHDGSAKTLEEAVTLMARYQVGEELTPGDITSIITWLGSLTGEVPEKYIDPPHLPQSP